MSRPNEERRRAAHATPFEKISHQAAGTDHAQDTGLAPVPAPRMRSAFAQRVVAGSGMRRIGQDEPSAPSPFVDERAEPPEIVEIVSVRLDDLTDRHGCPVGGTVRIDLGRRGLLPMERLWRLHQYVRGASRVELVGSGAAVRDAAGYLRAVSS